MKQQRRAGCPTRRHFFWPLTGRVLERLADRGAEGARRVGQEAVAGAETAFTVDRERGLRARYGFLTNPPRTYGATVRKSF